MRVYIPAVVALDVDVRGWYCEWGWGSFRMLGYVDRVLVHTVGMHHVCDLSFVVWTTSAPRVLTSLHTRPPRNAGNAPTHTPTHTWTQPQTYTPTYPQECPFWVMNVMCSVDGGCNACECDEDEIPLPWKVRVGGGLGMVRCLYFCVWSCAASDDTWMWKCACMCLSVSVYVNVRMHPYTYTPEWIVERTLPCPHVPPVSRHTHANTHNFTHPRSHVHSNLNGWLGWEDLLRRAACAALGLRQVGRRGPQHVVRLRAETWYAFAFCVCVCLPFRMCMVIYIFSVSVRPGGSGGFICSRAHPVIFTHRIQTWIQIQMFIHVHILEHI